MEDKLFISQPRINKGIGSIRESEIRKVRLPFDEFGGIYVNGIYMERI